MREIKLPSPIGHINLNFDEVLSFSSDELGGVLIVLKEQVADIHPEIISGYPYNDFKIWYEANKA